MTYHITIPGQPVPASRPRVSKWGTYYLKTYKDWMTAAHKSIPKGPGELQGPLHCKVTAIFSKAKTSKLKYPRADNDNIEKAVWDAITHVGGYWGDDNDIVSNETIKRFAEPGEEPRVLIEISQL